MSKFCPLNSTRTPSALPRNTLNGATPSMAMLRPGGTFSYRSLLSRASRTSTHDSCMARSTIRDRGTPAGAAARRVRSRARSVRGGEAGLACLSGSVGATLIIMPETVTWPLDDAGFVAGTGAAGGVMFGVRATLPVTACDAGSVTAGEVAEFVATDVPAANGTDMFSGTLGGAGGTIAGAWLATAGGEPGVVGVSSSLRHHR